MSWLHRVRNALRSERLSRDFDREMAFHIDERVEELRASGLSNDDAVREARRQFGNTTALRERTRDADIAAWLDSLLGDLRYALRALRRSPAFAVTAVASLALGIGATTAIYTLIDVVVLRSLPVPHPEELVQVRMGQSDMSGYFTNPLWEQLRDRQSGFVALTAFSSTSFNTADVGEARSIRGSWVSGDYFKVFVVKPAVGRLLAKSDDTRGCPAVGVLGYGYWRREYGGRGDVVGTSVRIDGAPVRIVGIAADGFVGPEVGSSNDIYLPLCSVEAIRGKRAILDARSNWWLNVIGRRDRDLTLEQIGARVASIAPASYAATVPEAWSEAQQTDYLKRRFVAAGARQGLSQLRGTYSKALVTLMGAVVLVLLIACGNVANLLLARGAARRREVAIRLAIGAERWRLARQLFTESAVLALFGAGVGVVIARWATRALVALIAPGTDSVALDLSVNLRVLAFAALTAVLTAMIFGLVPAWRGTRVDPQAAMKANGRGVAEGHARFTLGKALVVAQVALSLVLLAGAGLFVGSLRKLTRVDAGFRADGVLIVNVDLRRAGVTDERVGAVQRDVLDRLRATPGVLSAAITAMTPLGSSTWNDEVFVDGYQPANPMDAIPWFNEVTSSYFATLETRLLAGRDFDASDVPGSRKKAIVNDAMARRFYGDASPLGKTFRTKAGDVFSDPYTIVGVVENAKYVSLRENGSPIVYLPASQNTTPSKDFTVLLRGTGEASALVAPVKKALAELQPAAMLELHTLARQVDASLQRERVLAVLSSLFGGAALLLSILGLYGVITYAVARRRNEIGVRIALGAARSRVLGMVLADVARVIAIGLVAGAAAAAASGQLVTTFLYGLAPADPRVVTLAGVVLAMVGLGAGLIPAWRASRVDPVAALRED